jgi:hypothetical protein
LAGPGSSTSTSSAAANSKASATRATFPFDVVEDKVIEHYRTVQLKLEFIEWVHGQIDNALQDQAGARRQLRDQIQEQFTRLQTRVDNLIDLVADGGRAGSKAREKVTEIERERAALETCLGTIEDNLSIGAEFLKGLGRPLHSVRSLCESSVSN